MPDCGLEPLGAFGVLVALPGEAVCGDPEPHGVRPDQAA